MSNAVKASKQCNRENALQDRLAAEAVVDAALLTNEALSQRYSWSDSSSEFRDELIEEILHYPERTAALFSSSYLLN